MTSPTPWSVHGEQVIAADGLGVICDVRHGGTHERNAEHIARCVNAHAALLAACEQSLQHLMRLLPDGLIRSPESPSFKLETQLREAIAIATKGAS